mmetsp:Transcript_7800/g.28824  ORF Transcript_7800/g.28824 Transcript_7800/m.28824 type:complete len:103 (+) Transcript_7800:275-583(+)
MYLATWAEFAERAEALWRGAPERARYCIKYRHADGKLVLKCTDDRVCYKFATDQQQDLKKFEKLTTKMMVLMANGDDLPEEDEAAEAPPAANKPEGKRARRS